MSSSNDDSLLTRPLAPEDWQALVDAWELPDFAASPEPEVPDADAATVEELAALREEAEHRGYEAGLVRGRDAGYQEGMAAAREEIEGLENRLRGWLSHLERPLALLDDEVTEQLTALATQIARVMLAREVRADNSGLPSIAREALTALPVSVRAVTLRCAPPDESALRELIDDPRFERLDLRADASIRAGGVIVESGDARVDASLANRWAATLDHLIGRVYPGPDQPIPEAVATPSEMEPSENDQPEATAETPVAAKGAAPARGHRPDTDPVASDQSTSAGDASQSAARDND
ncbi:MAG: hypothetical protein JXJ30_05255 [Halothiobacillaceae bacterium]|nr:hypothetical protein [Halothiobacillaceae bacterium]HER34893.1 hypothetical protein [Halothiobacillaceae bacterium]